RHEKFIVWLIGYYGHPPDTTAEDLKQEYLRRILERNDIAKLDRARGSFRAWLRTSVRYFLSNERSAWRVQKTGRSITAPATCDASATMDPEERLCARMFTKQIRFVKVLRAAVAETLNV